DRRHRRSLLMPGLFVNDGSLGSSIASAFGGGSFDPSADARLLQSLGSLRIQQDQAALAREKALEDRRQFEETQRLRQQELESSTLLREQQIAASKAE